MVPGGYIWPSFQGFSWFSLWFDSHEKLIPSVLQMCDLIESFALEATGTWPSLLLSGVIDKNNQDTGTLH
jgi:hypothetical protein